MVCREWSLDKLLTVLALHRLDLVISDSPIPSTVSVRAFSHRLGTSGVSFFAAPDLLKRYASSFPCCLDGAPLLLPGDASGVAADFFAITVERRNTHPCVIAITQSARNERFAPPSGSRRVQRTGPR